MTEQLSVCFIWHMHQPLYKDRLSGMYLMPWVRLHGIKDYLDMALILKDFPRIRQTFNLVPSLIEQINDYAWNEAVDMQLLLTVKPENEYTEADKLYLASESFHANLERQIKPHDYYFELFQKRQHLSRHDRTLKSCLDDFSNQEYADMAAWMNLAWFDPMWVESIPELDLLIEQGRDFTLAQRQRIIEIEREILQKTIPVYKELQQTGQLEVITSPYYHPILPLLIDTNAARQANPLSTLPTELYLHSDDARHQITAGLDFYKANFGEHASGMWPSELSVSPTALAMIANSGIKWVVLDEELLAKTIERNIHRDEHGNLNDAHMLCQPYRLFVGDEEITLMFREVVLSNEISFSYAHRSASDASSAMYMRLKHIQQQLLNSPREGCVVIALDGENCWETYDRDGRPFLTELYTMLSQDHSLNVCTVSQYLAQHPATETLYNLQTGSWISADFHIWIGEPVKNRAWDLLSQTRRFLHNRLAAPTTAFDAETQKKAWEEIYTSEGSDWFWWFGQPNNSEHDAMFDQQFRLRLQNVYRLLGEAYPKQLDVPIEEQVNAASAIKLHPAHVGIAPL